MKLSRETYGLAFIGLLFLGGLYLVTALAELPFFARLSDMPWLLPIVNVAMVSIYFYKLYRGVSPAGKILLREHTLLVVIWFVAWIVVVAVLVAQNDRHTWDEKALRASCSWMIILPHGATLIMLAEKWQSAAHLADDCRPVLRRCYHGCRHFGWTVLAYRRRAAR